MDDINILTYSASTQRNCEALRRVYSECETWAKRHRSKFNPQKYDLIHFTRRPRRFKMDEGIKIEGQQIIPSTCVRILGVQLDTALRWKAHLRAVEAKATRTLSAFSSTAGSTWGMSQAAGRRLYIAIARPIITYGASAWYTPASVKGHRKTVDSKLKALQGKFLRLISGSYRATATEAAEIETYIQPIDIFIDGLVMKATLRTCASQASQVIEEATNRIRVQMRSNRGRPARVRKTDGVRKREWLATFNKTDIIAQPVFTDPPWTVDFRRPLNASEEQAIRIEELQKNIYKNGKERWQRRWQQGEKGQHLRKLVASPSQAVRRLHEGRPKPESAILTQLRTGKVGFNAFLYNRSVPGVWSRRCACEQGAMTVKHVLLVCPKWQDIRQEIGFLRRDMRWALTTREGAAAAIKLIVETGLLEQFQLYASEAHRVRARPSRETVEEEEEEEDEVEIEEGEEEEEEE